MKKKHFTYAELLKFDMVAGKWLSQDKKNEDSKLGYAIKKIGDQISAILKVERKEIDLKLKDLEIDSYETDKNGYIVRDEQGKAVQKPESLKKLERAKIQLVDDYERNMNEKKFEIEPYYASIVPDDLTEYELDVLIGLVVEPQLVDEQIS